MADTAATRRYHILFATASALLVLLIGTCVLILEWEPVTNLAALILLGLSVILTLGLWLTAKRILAEAHPPSMRHSRAAEPLLEQHRRQVTLSRNFKNLLPTTDSAQRLITIFSTSDNGQTFSVHSNQAHKLKTSTPCRPPDTAPSDGESPLSAFLAKVWRTGTPVMIQYTYGDCSFPAYVCRLNPHEIGVIHTDEQSCRLPLYEQIFDTSMEGIVLITKDGHIATVNPAFLEITEYTAENIVGQHIGTFRSHTHDELFYENMIQAVLTTGKWSGEIWGETTEGKELVQQVSISAIVNSDGEVTHYTAVFHDITDLKKKEALITHQAYHDALTSLPNRLLLTDRMRLALSRAERRGLKVAIIFIDLDNFKTINDSLGHTAGDVLLQKVAERVKRLLRGEDTISRLGGDEFVIMMEDVHDPREAVRLARRVLDSLTVPFVIKKQTIFITTSIGITYFPNDGRDPDTLIKNADLAMYKAKESGKNSYWLYTPEMNSRVVKRLSLENELRTALERDEFFVRYQPKHDTFSLATTGVEALVRWQNRKSGIVSPLDFIPIAEETGLIIPIGELVLEKACITARQQLENGHGNLQIAVNLSPKQFQQRKLTQTIEGILARTGVLPQCLELEITESMLITDIDATVRKLEELTEMGITFAIDDFGTGYSSLNYLRRLPIHTLKIDRSFISEIHTDPSAADLVGTMIILARNFGKKVVAEGVETKEQFHFLLANRCDQIQGFYFSEPLTPDELERYLSKDIEK